MRNTNTVRAVVNGIERFHVKACRAEALLDELHDGSVSLIVTDPPYFKVKDEAWDRAWKKPEEFLRWVGGIFDKFRRVLAPNGSLYVFASPQMAWGVEGEVRKRFEVLSTPVWAKPTDGYAAGDKRATAFKARDVEALRTYFGYSERVIFAEQIGSDLANGSGFEAECDRIRGIMFAPLRDYLENTRVSCGASREECNAACGFAAAPGAMASRHYFSRSQWWLPTREHYAKIDALFQSRGAEALMSYESIRAEYERIDRELTAHCAELEHLRRPFSVSYEVPYTDVWTCPTVESYAGKHGCEKPWSMGLDIVRASSRPGDLVLDCFSGSGCFPAAAVALGRRAIACDMSPEWANVTRERCQRALENPDAASDNRRAAPVRVAS